MSIGLLGSLLTNSTLGYPGISHLGLLRLDPNQIILEPGWWTVIRVYCFCRRLAHGLLLGAARWFIILAVAESVASTVTTTVAGGAGGGKLGTGAAGTAGSAGLVATLGPTIG